MLFSIHIRLGRTMLKMSQSELADATGLSVVTIKRLESNEQAVENSSIKIVKKIKKTFEDRGIEFIDPEDEDGISGIGIKFHGDNKNDPNDKKTIQG